jgi:hypothetical protein
MHWYYWPAIWIAVYLLGRLIGILISGKRQRWARLDATCRRSGVDLQ